MRSADIQMSTGRRVQANFIARRERQILDWFCAHMPERVTPDILTAVGVVGALMVFAGYIGTRFDRHFVLIATLGFVVHWFGDSLDGSLARHRRRERVRYGYFLDSTTDALCNLIIMVGVGLSSYVRMDAALFALLGYYLLCMYVFINYHLNGVYQLSFVAFGPTELRIGLIAMNMAIFVEGQMGFTINGLFISDYDVLMVATGTIFVGLFVSKMIAGIRELREGEKDSYARQEAPDRVKISGPTPGLSVNG